MIARMNDNGRCINLKLREKLEVRLPESQVSGYMWEHIKGCPVLSREDSEYREEGEARFTGLGERSWYFTARATGECRLEFSLRRPWSVPRPEFFLLVRVS